MIALHFFGKAIVAVVALTSYVGLLIAVCKQNRNRNKIDGPVYSREELKRMNAWDEVDD